MAKALLFAFVVCIGLANLSSQAASTQTPLHSGSRERLLFDDDWRFALGNANDPEKDFKFGTGLANAKAGVAPGALATSFDDSGWRRVDLPHDWAVELPFQNSKDENLESHGYKPLSRNYPQYTIGWYRRAFEVPASDLGKRIVLTFDGVFRDCQVWVNGHLVAKNESGYSGFRCDVTDYLNYGGKNAVAVRVDASQVEGWFYEGAGIYRHVWLEKTPPLHIANNGVFVITTTSGNVTTVIVKTEIQNESDQETEFRLSHRIRDAKAESQSRPTRIAAWGTVEITTTISIQDARLWSTEDPNLYKLISDVIMKDKAVDSVATTFGVRTLRFDKDQGFFLNGKRVEIKGVCDHQDHAGVGTAIPDRLNEWRIEQLKQYGVNALRTSHNPPTPELLDICDRLGILVMDENRLIGSSPEILSQLSRLIKRDRNHPSVIMWSIGNEEWEQNTPRAAMIGKTMYRTVKALDPTRPVTYASNAGNKDIGINTVVDLRGFNYKNISDIDKYHHDHPEQILYGSEEASTVSTRGVYANDRERAYVSAYDVNRPKWGATAEDWWTFYDARPWLAGAFVWTGFDYRGEPTPYSWPNINSHFGILDTCGFPKDVAYYYQAWWTDKPVLHILPHWNWPGREGQPIDVWCFSNCQDVELFLNGKSLGRQTMKKDSHLEWKVTYEPGMLEARGYNGGEVVITSRVETTGPPAALILKADPTSISADGSDVAIVTVSAVDAKGRLVPVSNNMVHFDLRGAGKIIGVGNGDPSCHEPDRFLDQMGTPPHWQRSLFNGYSQIIVQGTKVAGKITLKASAEGLEKAEVTINAR